LSEPSTLEDGLPRESFHPTEPQCAPPLWGYRDLLIFFAFAAIALGFSFAAVVLGVSVLRAVTGAPIHATEGPYQLPIVLAIQFLWWAIVLLYIYRLVTVKYGLAFDQAVAWVPFRGPGLSYLTGGVLVALSVGLLSNVVPMPTEPVPIEELLSQPGALLLFALFGVLVAPAIEEVVFRGFLYPAVERRNGQTAAIVSTSALFSVLHYSQYGGHWALLLLLFYVGAVLGIVRARSGSTKATTILHSSYNATFLVALHFAQQGATT
jgi:membrane protease YdiL (CAAX protease family)